MTTAIIVFFTILPAVVFWMNMNNEIKARKVDTSMEDFWKKHEAEVSADTAEVKAARKAYWGNN